MGAYTASFRQDFEKVGGVLAYWGYERPAPKQVDQLQLAYKMSTLSVLQILPHSSSQ